MISTYPSLHTHNFFKMFLDLFHSFFSYVDEVVFVLLYVICVATVLAVSTCACMVWK